jgi:outer membrane protein TolC
LVLEGDFEIGKKLGELDEAKASLREMKMQLSELESGVKLEVTKLFYEMQDAKKMVEAYKDAVEAARGWVIAKTDLYENDLCSMNDVVTALVQFFQTRMEYLKAVYDYNVAVYALERAVSESLSWEKE